jgi:hypothetical protein
VILAGAGVVVCILAALGALPAPPLWLAVSLLVLLCGASALVRSSSRAASLTPVHLRGRGSAAANLGQVTGSFLLPVVSGLIAGLFEQTAMGYPPSPIG